MIRLTWPLEDGKFKAGKDKIKSKDCLIQECSRLTEDLHQHQYTETYVVV